MTRTVDKLLGHLLYIVVNLTLFKRKKRKQVTRRKETKEKGE